MELTTPAIVLLLPISTFMIAILGSSSKMAFYFARFGDR